MKTILILLAWCAGAFAQKDFLTPDEVDQIRLVQEPNERLKLYVKFGRLRVDLLEQTLAKQKTGRSGLIHDTLDEYAKIIDAMDMVADDAVRRKLDISAGLAAVAQFEKDTLPKLEKLRESPPPDFSRYQFALDQAILATEDSLELTQKDLGVRGREVAEKEREQKKSREALMTSEEQQERKAEAKKIEEAKPGGGRKPPTLLKKGETLQKKP
jgi:hypothetical protein